MPRDRVPAKLTKPNFVVKITLRLEFACFTTMMNDPQRARGSGLARIAITTPLFSACVFCSDPRSSFFFAALLLTRLLLVARITFSLLLLLLLLLYLPTC